MFAIYILCKMNPVFPSDEKMRILKKSRFGLVWFGLVWFYGISTFVGYLRPDPFYVNNQFYLKQFGLAWVHSLIIKNISISNDSD